MKTKLTYALTVVLCITLIACKKEKTEIKKNCIAVPSVYAGQDTTIINSTKLELKGITDFGKGKWTILSGTGGSIDSTALTIFTGELNNSYKLVFSSVNDCGTTTDTLNINLVEQCTETTIAKAGNDIVMYNETKASLRAVIKTTEGTGKWSILSGERGSITDPTNALSEFSGNANENYSLVWTVTKNCAIATDTVSVSFPTKEADANITAAAMIDNIHWIVQAAFRIETPKMKIYIDPQSITSNDVADVILITHSHGDHFSVSEIKKLAGPKTIIIAPADCNYTGVYAKRIILKPGESYTAQGLVEINAVPAYNIVKASNHPKANNWVGYVIKLNGVTIYHAGDTERIPEMKNIDCDIAMLPLGQTYTMVTVNDAAESAKDVKAEYAIPMHYGGPEGTAADAQTFKTLLDGSGINVIIKVKGAK